MWPFKRSPNRREPDGEWWDRLAKVESSQRALELEWENTFEKIKRAMAKLGKRAAALEEETHAPSAGDPLVSDMKERGRLLAVARAKYGHNGGV